VTVEEQLRSELAGLVERVRPMPDPLGRLLVRGRRRRHVRRLFGALVAVLALSFASLVPVGGSSGPPQPLDGWRQWSMTIVDGPPRGGLIAQNDFIVALTRLLSDEVRAGTNDPALNGFHGDPPSDRRVRILFAEDIEQRRVVLVALTAHTGDPFEGTVLVWIDAPRGAAPAHLAQAVAATDRPADTSFSTSDAQPFLMTSLDIAPAAGVDAHVGLAPPGCSITTAASPALTDWRPEPTGSYIIRTAETARAEWWRVTCDGVIRYVTPAPPATDPSSRDRVEVTDEDVERALASAPGSADPGLTRGALSVLAYHGGYALTARPSVVWGGRVTGLGTSGVGMVVAVAPMIGEKWIGVVSTEPVLVDPDRPQLGVGSFTTADNPLDPSTLLAIPLQPEPHTALLVIAPRGTDTVRVIDAGGTLAEAAVTERGTLVPIPAGADIASVQVEAMDTDGARIATTPLVGTGLQTAEQVSWS
jgi:hypothetical protein